MMVIMILVNILLHFSTSFFFFFERLMTDEIKTPSKTRQATFVAADSQNRSGKHFVVISLRKCNFIVACIT